MKTHPFKVDRYGHIIREDGHTDPYGLLTFCVGDSQDFYCFDYAYLRDRTGQLWCVLHSVINSETGCFIQDGEYAVIKVEELADAIRQAANMVADAHCWCDHGGKRIRFNHAESFSFVRDVAIAGAEAMGMEFPELGERALRAIFTWRQITKGGKRINAFVNRLSSYEVIY